MEILITDKALAYIRKIKAKNIQIGLIPGETDAGCGCGSTRKYYTTSISVVSSDAKLTDLYEKLQNKYDINIFVPLCRKYLFNNKDIIIDLESFLFIKKLILKNLEIIMI